MALFKVKHSLVITIYKYSRLRLVDTAKLSLTNALDCAIQFASLS